MLRTLYAAPGNPGIAQHGTCVALDPADHVAVRAFCAKNDIGLIVIGPEAPLVDGLGDSLREAGFAVFGPDRIPAQLEGSKGYTKELCARHGIPTARFARAESLDAAKTALKDFGLPVVIKADGLAAGKGVIIATTAEEAATAVDTMFDGGFGEAGASVVIEEFLTGEEVSFFAITDGETVLPFGSAQDHKRVGDGDVGPNTGGMGAYSPASILTPALEARALDEIVVPTVRALREQGTPYSGILYAGLMLTESGPSLIEYNARFGDPECQVLMMRLESDILPILLATAGGKLSELSAPLFSSQAAVTVVMAAHGYPGMPEKGGAVDLHGAEAEGAVIFHAGTAQSDGLLTANGGRVLTVTARGASVRQAQVAVYQAVDKIHFPAGFCRRDIGWREIAREQAGSKDD